MFFDKASVQDWSVIDSHGNVAHPSCDLCFTSPNHPLELIPGSMLSVAGVVTRRHLHEISLTQPSLSLNIA